MSLLVYVLKLINKSSMDLRVLLFNLCLTRNIDNKSSMDVLVYFLKFVDGHLRRNVNTKSYSSMDLLGFFLKFLIDI